MKVLVTGSWGLVGSRFIELYSEVFNLLTPSHQELDITDLSSIKRYVDSHNFEVIVNFAAYTNVSEAEKQRDDKNGDCWKVNVGGIHNFLEIIKGKIKLIQISTDMVFSASIENPGPYAEDHKLEGDSNKVTWYGFTKAEAERLISDRGTIVRIIYPVRANFSRKLDYIRKTVQLFDQKKLYPIFTDQQISITFVDEVCLALGKIIEQNASGIFHTSSSDTTNPFDLYSYALEKIRGAKNVLTPGSLKEFLKTVDNPVRYPLLGGLKVDQTEKRLGIKFSTWKQIVDTLVLQGITV